MYVGMEKVSDSVSKFLRNSQWKLSISFPVCIWIGQRFKLGFITAWAVF